jgi:hypothetical protein
MDNITPDTVKKIEELRQLKANYDFKKREISRLEKRMREVMKDEISTDIYEEVVEALNLLEQKVDDFKERTAKEQKEKEESAKFKALDTAIKKVEEAGFGVNQRPKIFFGTTEDHSYRIICMGPERSDGSRFTVYWSGGATWSDNSGSHYGESAMHFAMTNMDGKLLKENRYSFNLKEIRDHLDGGRISVERLKKIEGFIKQYIPNYVPLLVPATHYVVYEKA